MSQLVVGFLFSLMIIVYINGSILSTCPDSSLCTCPPKVLWRRVALTACPSDPEYYHCLERIGNNRFDTICKSSLRMIEGSYPVLDERSGNFHAEKCPATTYQPLRTFSWERNMCTYQKTRCNEEGQIIHSNGTTIEDRTCRCDYHHGYTFIHTPVNRCYCIPSQEDCSCYKQTCNNSNVVNQDYICSDPSDKDNKTYTCTEIGTDTPGTEVKDEVMQLYHNTEYDIPSYNIVKSDNSYRRDILVYILLLIFLYILIAIIMYIWWRYHKHTGALKVKTNRDIHTDHIGGTVTLEVQVKELGSIADFIFRRAHIAEVTWTKYTNSTEENVPSGEYTSDDYQYLEIKTLRFEDEAEYRCTVTNRAGHMFTSGPIKVKVLGSSGHALLQNIPEDIRKLGKSAVEEYRRLLKTEVHNQKTIHLVIFGPKDSGKTSLWRKLIGMEQEERSQGLLQKYCLKIQDGNWTVTDYSECTVNSIIKSKMESEKKKDDKEGEIIDVIIREIPGQLEYCAALAPFVSRHAIFILTTDVNEELCSRFNPCTFSNPALEREPCVHLKKGAKLVADWIKIIHSLKPAIKDPSTHLKLEPSMILVGSHKDKFQFMKNEDLNRKHTRDVYGCVNDIKSEISKHVIYNCVISNLQSQSEEIQKLQDLIMKESGSTQGWHDEIPVRYFWFEEILLNQRHETDVMTFDEVVQLGKDHGYPVTDKHEFHLFLSYQHKVRNIIYWEDMSGYVIISPAWLNGIITELITLCQNEPNSDYGRTGQIKQDVLNEIINSNKKEQSAAGGLNHVNVLQTFDIVVGINKKSSEHSILYVPCVIPSSHTADVVTMFENERRNKTSFLSFSFGYLPAVLVNHIMIRLIEKYEVSKVPSQNWEVAIYYRTLVLEYNPCKNQKLYFLSIHNELLFQVWSCGVQQISECFEDFREMIEDIIKSYKSRHEMNLNFKHKLKYPDCQPATSEGWDVVPDRTYYCRDHREHQEHLYSVWFTKIRERNKDGIEGSEGYEDDFEDDDSTAKGRKKEKLPPLGPKKVVHSIKYSYNPYTEKTTRGSLPRLDSKQDEDDVSLTNPTDNDCKQLFKVAKELAPPADIIIRTLVKKTPKQRMQTKDRFKEMYDLSSRVGSYVQEKLDFAESGVTTV